MSRLPLLVLALAAVAVGCQCGGFDPVVDCNGQPCDGGAGGGATGGGGGDLDAGGGGGGDLDGGGGGGGDLDGGGGGGGDLDGGGGGGGGGDLDGGGGGGGTDAGVFDFCSDLATKRCDFAVRCHTESNDDLSQNRGNNKVASGQQATCVTTERQECLLAQAGFAAGRNTLDMARYTACFDALYPAGTCARDLNVALAACDLPKILQPAVTAGDLCTNDTECIAGFCNVATGAVCGRCQPYTNADGGMGQCVRDRQCDPATSYCPGADGTTTRTCANFKGLDAGCNGSALEIGQQEECGPAAVCTGSFVTPGGYRCAPGKAEGTSCIKNRFECQRSGRGRFELTCATVGPMDDRCVKAYATTAGGNCGTGESFFGTSLGPFCLETEWCSTGVCTPRRVANQPCTADEQCQWGLECPGFGTGRVCTAYKDQGVACGNSGECLNLLSCIGNTCSASLSALGGACRSNGQPPACAEGWCDAAGNNTGVCQAPLADGAMCTASAQCASFSCGMGGTCASACF